MLLLIPGPVTTHPAVRAAAAQDYAPWDLDFRAIYARIRARSSPSPAARTASTPPSPSPAAATSPSKPPSAPSSPPAAASSSP